MSVLCHFSYSLIHTYPLPTFNDENYLHSHPLQLHLPTTYPNYTHTRKMSTSEIDVIMELLKPGHRGTIDRQVKSSSNGVIARTRSFAPQTTQLIQTHVQQMKSLIGHRAGKVNEVDPLFRNLNQVPAGSKALDAWDVDGGVIAYHRATPGSSDACVPILISQHAQVVSKYISFGMPEALAKHPAPCFPEQN
jgi:hypothetical protein